jgi:hypothetical protein
MISASELELGIRMALNLMLDLPWVLLHGEEEDAQTTASGMQQELGQREPADGMHIDLQLWEAMQSHACKLEALLVEASRETLFD